MRARQIDIDPHDVPPIPHLEVAVVETERTAAAAMKAAAEASVAEIKAAIHDRSGTLSRSVGSSVRRLPGGGVSVRFGAIKKVAFMSRKGDRAGRDLYGAEGGKTKKQSAYYADMVDRGTGVRGPLGRKIKRPGLIPVAGGVRRPSGVGQAPQGMFRKASQGFFAEVPATDELIERTLTANIERRRR